MGIEDHHIEVPEVVEGVEGEVVDFGEIGLSKIIFYICLLPLSI